MRICVLGSGSTGNATVISAGGTHILIDAGLSAKFIRLALQHLGILVEDLAAIIISHEHGDHIKALPVLLRKTPVPLYATRATFAGINLGEARTRVEFFETGQTFAVGGLEVDPFSISHDAADPSGFIVRANGTQLAHVTDLGCMTELVRQRLRSCRAVVIESNHDEDMLKIGPYPWELKQRVLGRQGHMSNRELGQFFREDFDGEARHIVLAHLSRTNNHPEIARLAALESLGQRPDAKGRTIRLTIAAHDRPTPVIEID